MDIDANVVIDNMAIKIAQQAKEIAILQAKLEASQKGEVKHEEV